MINGQLRKFLQFITDVMSVVAKMEPGVAARPGTRRGACVTFLAVLPSCSVSVQPKK